jgi:putative DNA modification/repair radical SAM protein
MPTSLRRRLAVLADAARFDAPCAARVGTPAAAASPGSGRQGIASGRIAAGRREPAGRPALPVFDGEGVERSAIYYSVAADGRRVPLLKLLLTNHCAYDCAYCPLRRSADAERARLTVGEVVRLTIDYHRRGLVDGLFLSAAVDASADDTMARLVAVARTLRLEHHFAGYVHLKVVPEASPELVDEAGRWADRVSVNVELARQQDLDALAPGRRLVTIHAAMDRLRDGIAEAHEARVRLATAHAGRASWTASRWNRASLPRFAPAGQVTQMVVGADGARDADVLGAAAALYRRQRLRRVYFGGYVPVDGAPAGLPTAMPTGLRERRLYEADWLIRQYGFSVDELVPRDAPDLAPDIDPKLAWALRNPAWFPVDVNRAAREELLVCRDSGIAPWTGSSPSGRGTGSGSRTSCGCGSRREGAAVRGARGARAAGGRRGRARGGCRGEEREAARPVRRVRRGPSAGGGGPRLLHLRFTPRRTGGHAQELRGVPRLVLGR